MKKIIALLTLLPILSLAGTPKEGSYLLIEFNKEDLRETKTSEVEIVKNDEAKLITLTGYLDSPLKFVESPGTGRFMALNIPKDGSDEDDLVIYIFTGKIRSNKGDYLCRFQMTSPIGGIAPKAFLLYPLVIDKEDVK